MNYTPYQTQGAAGGSTTTTVQPVTISTPEDWANVQLAYMGYPDTESNVSFLLGWYQREGGNWQNTATYNPLNTTLVVGGRSNPMNAAGVQAYSGWAQGLQATAQTLAGYPQITQALAAGNASQADQQGALAADLAKWSGGAYSSVTPAGPTSTTNAVLTSSTWKNIQNWINSATGLGNMKKYDKAVGNASSLGGSISNPLSGLAAIGHFFGALGKAETWIRIAEVAGGVLAIGMGVVLLGKAMGMGAAVAGIAGTIAHVPGVADTPAGDVLRAKAPTAVRSYSHARTTRRQAAQSDTDELAYRRSQGAARENRAAYRKAMDRRRDTSDMRRRTA